MLSVMNQFKRLLIYLPSKLGDTCKHLARSSITQHEPLPIGPMLGWVIFQPAELLPPADKYPERQKLLDAIRQVTLYPFMTFSLQLVARHG